MPKTCWIATASLLCSGCYHYTPTLAPFSDPRAQEASEALDKLDWYVGAYGSLAISSPLLVQPDDTFKFVLDPTQFNANTAFANAGNLVGRSAGLDESAQASGATVQVSGDLLAAQATIIKMQAAYQQYQALLLAAQALGDPTQQATARANALAALGQTLGTLGGSTASIPSTTPPVNTAAGVFTGNGSFAAPQSLFLSGTPGVTTDTRTAIRTAAGDIATYAMLSFLADPGKIAQFKEKHVVFGVSQVSVTPGWRTRRGAAAEVSAHIKYKATVARPEVRGAFLGLKGGSAIEQAALEQLQSCVVRSLPRPAPEKPYGQSPPPPFDGAQFKPYVYTANQDHDDTPIVAAVSPMAEGQSLDLQSATRRQTELSLRMAIALSYAGLGAQAAPFADFAKRRQNDIETRTNNVVVNSFNIPDGGFGFRVLPQIVADPLDGGTAVTMGASAFPTLIVIGTEDQDVRPKVYVYTDGGDTRCTVVERRLHISEATRWIPTTEPCIRQHPSSNPCVGEILTHQERFRVREEARIFVKSMLDGDLRDSMLLRYNFLDGALNNGTQDIYLPLAIFASPTPPPNPAANTIAPAELEVDRTTTGIVAKPVNLLIAGADLDKIDLAKVKAIVGDIDWIKDANASPTVVQTTPNATNVGNALQLVFQVKSDRPVVFQLTVKNSTASTFSRPLIVKTKGSFITRTFQNDKAAGKATDVLEFSPTITDEVMKAEIERNKEHYPNQKADVKVRVDADAREKSDKDQKPKGR